MDKLPVIIKYFHPQEGGCPPPLAENDLSFMDMPQCYDVLAFLEIGHATYRYGKFNYLHYSRVNGNIIDQQNQVVCTEDQLRHALRIKFGKLLD